MRRSRSPLYGFRGDVRPLDQVVVLLGTVALVHSYPGLYKAVVDAMARQRFAIPMRVAEETVAGGANRADALESV